MKRVFKAVLLPAFGFGLIVAGGMVLSGCDTGVTPAGSSSGTVAYTVEFSDGTTVLAGDTGYDFGVVEAEAGSVTVSVRITNDSDVNIIVTAVSVSDTTNFTLSTPVLPGTIEPGQNGDYSITFNPAASGDVSADVSVTIDGLASPVVAQLTGEGNYAPLPLFGITVSDAEISGANGFYARDGFASADSSTRPKYTKTGTTTYYSYVYTYEVDLWCIADIPDADASGSNDPLYDDDAFDTSRLAPPPSGWRDLTGVSTSTLSIVVQDISGADPYSPTTLTANYKYSDAEGDSEAAGSALYQWYRSVTETGTYTAISGATSATYTTTDDDVGNYLKAGITVTAETGYVSGTEVLSPPTIPIELPPS